MSAFPHQFIAIEGNIGAGKSTLLAGYFQQALLVYREAQQYLEHPPHWQQAQ